jgi:RND family efflux transporter MFP subunit
MTIARVRAAAVVAPLVILVAACRGSAEHDESESASAAIVGAETAVVAAQPFSETITATGSVVVRAGHAASLAAPAAGRIARVLVAPGQRVARGQPLVVLDAAAIEASAQSAEAAVTAARQSVERTQRLVREGVSPRKDAEAAAAELARVQADLVAARRTAQLATLRAPIAGVVTRVAATIGGNADPSQPLVEIADPSALDLVLQATPTDAAHVRPGAAVALTAGQGGGESLGSGAVVDVAAVVDSVTRGVAIRVRVTAPRRVLRIGETVAGRITVASRPGALVVPAAALVPEGDGFKVFVVDGQQVAHARAVTVGGRTDAAAEIVAGLTAGERVVTVGAYGVDDGARIAPPGQPTSPAKTGATP